jgi:hypothetical protein
LDGETTLAHLIFRPETFFLGRTEGWAEARPLLGGASRRARVITEGRLEAPYGALHVDETFEWENGGAEVWRWVMTRGLDGRYVASEVLAGAGIVGRHEGDDYVLNFRRALSPKGGLIRAGYATRFSMLSPKVAIKHVRMSVVGLPLAVMVAEHHRRD